MSLQFTVSPDFPPTNIANWYLFNTWLQKAVELPIHLEMFADFETQRQAILADKIDMIYANPYDAAMLVREKGFHALARPKGIRDEAVIVANANSPYNSVYDLKPGIKAAATNDPTINLLSMMLLEPVELDESNIQIIKTESYQAAVRMVIQGEADVAFLLKSSMQKLSSLTLEQIKELLESQISDLHHTFLIAPTMLEYRERLLNALLSMNADPKGQEILAGLEIPAWEPVSQEEAEFMINLIEALK